MYRTLTELKKNGILGRDVVLRKTMLDECKGEKFEEVISTLALVVLRKACRSRHPELNLDQVDHMPKEQLVPLILAHRHSLQQTLQLRQVVSQHAEEYSARLASARTDLKSRLEEAQQGFEPVEERDLAHLSDVVRSVWVGDDRWADILLQGRTQSVSSLLQTSFEATWTEPTNDRPKPKAMSNDLAAELDERIGSQKIRLKKWKTFYASMENAKRGRLETVKTREPSSNPPALRFDRHKELRFESLQIQQPAKERLEPYHASVLRRMHEELAALDSFLPSANAHVSERADKHAPSSQARALEDTLDPISHFSATGTWDDSRIASSAQKDHPILAANGSEYALGIDMNEEAREEDMKSTALVDARFVDNSPGPGFSCQYEDSTNMLSSAPIGLTVRDDTPQTLQLGEDDKTPGLPNSKRSSASTLHERTRASLLPFAMDLSSPDVHEDPIADGEDDTSQLLSPLPGITASRGTLLERTRQSMSLLPNPPPKSKTSRQSSTRQPRFSEIFPVNQFETPSRAQTQQSGTWPPRSGSSTPRDKLFSEEADYASVFKSRPRIAISPSLSPERSNLGLDSMLADGVDDLDLNDNDETPSRGIMRNA